MQVSEEVHLFLKDNQNNVLRDDIPRFYKKYLRKRLIRSKTVVHITSLLFNIDLLLKIIRKIER